MPNEDEESYLMAIIAQYDTTWYEVRDGDSFIWINSAGVIIVAPTRIVALRAALGVLVTEDD